MTSSRSATANRALSYLTERAEDAQAAVIGIISGKGPSGAGTTASSTLADLGDVTSSGVAATRGKLESSTEYERLEGLRVVVAMLSKSHPSTTHLFPSVLKLTSAPSLQVKTLVYLITLRLAPSQPDVALLSINSFQRDLSDGSPLIRGMALRVLSGLSVKMAAPIMQMAIAKGSRDVSFYVRRIAADALGKCFELVPATLPDLVPHLKTLLGDRHPAVLGSALLAFQCTVPDRLELLHPHFRRICTALVDVDEWNQPSALRILASYARLYLRRPTEEQASKVVNSEKPVPGRTRFGQDIDEDVDLLLSKAEPLLSSRNAAVVLATAHFYFSLLPLSSPYHTNLVQPLLSLIRLHPTQSHLALRFIRRIHALRSDLFTPHIRSFLPRSAISSEPAYVTAEKLDLLVDFQDSSSSKLVLTELQEAVLHRSEATVVTRAVGALGRLAARGTEEDREQVTDILLSTLKEHKGTRSATDNPTVISQATSVLCTLIQKQPPSDRGQILHKLSLLLFKSGDAGVLAKTSITDPQGRASIYWLLGQYCQSLIRVISHDGTTTHRTLASTTLPDLLRKTASHFEKEPTAVKLAIVTFSAKLATVESSTDITALHTHILQLARYDTAIDVRDRARFLRSLTSALFDDEDKDAGATSGVRLRREQVRMVLFGAGDDEEPSDELHTPAAQQQQQDPALVLDPVTLCSASSHPLPTWHADDAQLPPSTIRDASAVVASAASASASVTSEPVSRSPVAISSSSASASASASATPSGSTTPRTGAPLKGKGKYQNLDEFLNESSAESSSSSSSSGEESSEEDDESEAEEQEESESQSESEEEEDDEDEDSELHTTATPPIPRISGELVQNQWA